jgi:VanZ family protein
MTTLMNLAEIRLVRWLVALVWMVFFIVILVQPDNNRLIETGIPPGPQTLERDIVFTFLHMLGFFITTALWWWTFWGYMPSRNAILVAVALALVISLLTEWMQGFVPERYPQFTDLLANAAGAGLVYLAVTRLAKRQSRRLIPG